MHLPARRIRIDHPDGGQVDVTAPLPAHFDESMGLLGFDPALGDALRLAEDAPPPSRAIKKAQAKAHAKQVRKERRRSEEHTSELQSLMRISYAVFCLKKKN